jgi:hypothetical protein
MFILSGDEHQLMPNENRVILRLQNENGRWNRESYVSSSVETKDGFIPGATSFSHELAGRDEVQMKSG